MRSRQLTVALGFFLAAALPAAPALAQSSAPQPYPAACSAASVPASESERAHTLYQAGKAYYDDNSNDAAIVQFREAYKKDCSKHELLIIISRAYQLKGDFAEAIRALETYLERVPSSPDAASLRTRIENMKKQQASQPAPVVAPPVTPVTPPPAVEMREHTVPPWILVGVGGAAVVVGVVILATAPSLPDGCDPDTKTCTRRPQDSVADQKDRQDRAGASQSQPVIGGVIAGVGGAFVLGGLLWHFLEPTGPVEKSAAKTKVTPQVSPGFAGLSLGGSF